MFAIPIPLFNALVLAYLGLRAAREGETPKMVLALIAVCAGQSLITCLNLFYGLHWLAPIQPVTAMSIPVVAYLTFVSTSIRPLQLLPDSLHLITPLLVLACIRFFGDGVDLVLILSFAGYGVLLLDQVRRSAEELPLIRLEHGNRAAVLWRWVAIILLASAISDTGILLAVLSGHDWLRPWIISIFSSTFLLLIGGLNLSDTLKFPQVEPDSAAPLDRAPRPSPATEKMQTTSVEQDGPDPALYSRLEALMRENRLYLDPDLTLGRIARKLQVPEKQLSATINRATGENVSRYINGYRIDHASDLLREGASVTSAMYASGFNTKSNFNREFLRVMGCPPSYWLTAQTKAPAFG